MADSSIGTNIRNRRIELGMTQEELATKIGYKSKSTINKVELGINDIPQSKIVKFADALQTTPKMLMGWEHVTPEMQKNSDVMADITVRMFSDIEFRNVVERNMYDKDFFALSAMLCALCEEQVVSVRQMLRTFFK